MAEIPEQPDWLRNHQAQQNGGKKTGHRWVPGMPSPNPSGRPKGIVDKRMRIMQALGEDAEEIVNVVKTAAREGNMQAIAMVLARVAPPLKATAETVEFDFDPNGSPSEMSSQILVAVSKGQLDPDTGRMLLDCVAAHIGMRDVETFADELRRVESKQQNRIRGGVLIDANHS